MSEVTTADTTSRDADLHVPLERVNFAPGMMLGVDATVAEQTYHRMRVSRHNYWFHGVGTLFGLAVTLDPVSSDDANSNTTTRLKVSPGIGIDGLGREVMSFEPYCVNLGDWFADQLADPQNRLADGEINTTTGSGKAINLLITMKYSACTTGLQPVLARKVNAGTDPVQASRTRDSLQLDIIPAPGPDAAAIFTRPGLALTDIDPDTDTTSAEQAHLASLSGDAARLARLQAQMLYGIEADLGRLELHGDPEDLARVLLATVTVPLRAAALPDYDPHINPEVIDINNLVRPFVNTADQFAWLAATETTS
ncbi:MAG: hypothetical protein P8X74_09580 [Reinekea sp.]